MKLFMPICLIVAMFAMGGCKETQERCDTVAIYLHEPGHYSVMVREGTELMSRNFTGQDTRIFTDVTNGQSCYYEARNVEGCGYFDVKLHVRSVDDINAAGWKVPSGKSTKSGATQRIDE